MKNKEKSIWLSIKQRQIGQIKGIYERQKEVKKRDISISLIKTFRDKL